MTGVADGVIWLLTKPALAQIAADPTARAVLAAGRPYELLGPRQRPSGDLGAAPTAVFASYAAIAEAVRAGNLPAGVKAILYDPEHWQFTPVEEQLDLEGHVTRATALAHGEGLDLIAAPAVTLTKVLGPSARFGGVGQGGPQRARRWRRPDRYDAYIWAGIAAACAAADLVVVQAQQAERDAARYRRFVEAAATQIRGEDRGTVVLAGLSTNPPGAPVDAGMLCRAIEAVRDLVSGFWLNVPAPGPRCPTCNPPRPDVGIEALRAAFG